MVKRSSNSCCRAEFTGIPMPKIHNAATNMVDYVIHLLYVFCGPRRQGDMDSICRERGVRIAAMDLERSSMHDILDDLVFDSLVEQTKSGKVQFLLLSPPCSTFSGLRGRGVAHARIRPLRDTHGPGIYGKKDLTYAEKQTVRTGAACALRAAKLAEVAMDMEIPVIIETCGKKQDAFNMFELPEYKASLAKHPDLDIVEFVRRPFRCFKRRTFTLYARQLGHAKAAEGMRAPEMLAGGAMVRTMDMGGARALTGNTKSHNSRPLA